MPEKTIHTSPDRFYRSTLTLDKNEQEILLSIEESDLYITLTSLIKKEEILHYVQSELYKLRAIIKAYTLTKPEFQHALTPLQQDLNADRLIQDMLEASAYAQIGPFSAVAGSIAEAIARKIYHYLEERKLPSDVLVENGGDIYIISKKPRIVAVLDKPDKSLFGMNIGVKLDSSYKNAHKVEGISLCSSSSSIGHSLSFGNADLVLIIAKHGSIADAFATAMCNELKSKNDFTKVIDLIKKNKKHGIQAILASCDNEILAYGDIELCEI